MTNQSELQMDFDDIILRTLKRWREEDEEEEEREAVVLAWHQIMATAVREHQRRQRHKDPNPPNSEIPKIFVAVLCSNCLTMQVKEKKNRRYKWKCDFCDAKQSVSKVFFEGTLVKEVEKFVQDFNRSGNLAGERGKDAVVSSFEEEIDGPSSSQRKRRRDCENDDDGREGEEQVKGNKQPMEEVQRKKPRSNKMY